VGRLNLFLKGNLDLRDSLHAFRVKDGPGWNGINAVLRARYPGTLARVRHETYTRSDGLVRADGVIPPALTEKSLPMGAYPLASQFSTAVFDAEADVVIFSVMQEVMAGMTQARAGDYRLYIDSATGWTPADKDWLRAAFAPLPRLDVDQSMENFARIIERRRETSDAPILIYNMSSAVPGEWIPCHQGVEGALSTRIKRFNLGLVELSEATGVSIVDVDRVLARNGGDRLRIDTLHLNAEGCRLVAEEVAAILADLGCL
jgi:hypothetical protein